MNIRFPHILKDEILIKKAKYKKHPPKSRTLTPALTWAQPGLWNRVLERDEGRTLTLVLTLAQPGLWSRVLERHEGRTLTPALTWASPGLWSRVLERLLGELSPLLHTVPATLIKGQMDGILCMHSQVSGQCWAGTLPLINNCCCCFPDKTASVPVTGRWRPCSRPSCS